MNIHDTFSKLPHSIDEAQDNFESHITDPKEKRKYQILVGAMSLITAAAIYLLADNTPDDSRCTIATISQGGNATDAVYDALEHLSINPDTVDGKVYAGQDAMAYIATADGLVFEGDTFEICVNPEQDEISSVNPANTNPGLYPINVK